MMKRFSSTETAFFLPEQNSMMRLQQANFNQYNITSHKFDGYSFLKHQGSSTTFDFLKYSPSSLPLSNVECPHPSPSKSALYPYALTTRRIIPT
ncbi:hypothetical protein [Neisseria sp. Marseille-Q2251]|uniref:hypothetical protein n=1 Tax=Neisseria sp. Marseille-Q2251 TaxID=2866585 RepID=UPI00313A0FB1